mgnify:CR=1 FL=1
MRLEELKNKTYEKQNEMIYSCQRYEITENLDNQKFLDGKSCCSEKIMMV